MEEQPSFTLKWPLKEIVLRSITVLLWNGADVLEYFEKLAFKFYHDEVVDLNEWRKSVENRVKYKASKLKLPKLMLDEIKRVVRPIGSEILKWKNFHELFLGMYRKDFNTCFLQRICWTSAGKIDYRKTAREIIRFEMLDNVKRYKLACLYCLEDEISATWKRLSKNYQKCFYKGEPPLRAQDHQLEFCWAYVLYENESQVDGVPERRFENVPLFCQNAFKSSAVKGNRAATEYFFQKLTCEERETSLLTTTEAVLADRIHTSHGSLHEFPEEKLTDVLCYLLFVMTPEQRTEIYNKFPFEVLRRFIDWPWSDHISAIAGLVFAFPPETLYESYLSFDSSNYPYRSFFYSELFQKIFPLFSDNFKKYIVDRECESKNLFTKFYHFSAESVTVLIRNVDAEDKVRLVSCQSFFALADYLSIVNEWSLVELWLREAALTKEDRMRVKDAYAEYLRLLDPYLKVNPGKTFFEILDKIDAECPSKRISEVETHSAPKKLR